MHRAWQPYVNSCGFAAVRYDFVGRVERLQRDFARLIAALKLEEGGGAAALAAHWAAIAEKTLPPWPLDGPDHLLHIKVCARARHLHNPDQPYPAPYCCPPLRISTTI